MGGVEIDEDFAKMMTKMEIDWLYLCHNLNKPTVMRWILIVKGWFLKRRICDKNHYIYHIA